MLLFFGVGVCILLKARQKPTAPLLYIIICVNAFVYCAKRIEIILSVARKNILLHNIGQVTNLNNQMKRTRVITAPLLKMSVYHCHTHTYFFAPRVQGLDNYFDALLKYYRTHRKHSTKQTILD